MTEHLFSLVPFPTVNISEIAITGKIARQNNRLSVYFFITGKTEEILFPKLTGHPTRKDDLWKATCFEIFLAIPHQPSYWEFNLSPSGDWNVYHMDEYRRVGFREETQIQQLLFSVRKESGRISVGSSVDISPIISIEHPIEVGITSVIQSSDGRETYWALTHPNPQPDFHLRKSFILLLAE